MQPKYLSARYSTYLPPGFTSWFKFYEAAKPYIQEDIDDLNWHHYMDEQTLRTPSSTRPSYTYSVRYIQKQALDELFELRQLQTFDPEELRHIYYALQFAEASRVFGADDASFRRLEGKVGDLLQYERQKERSA